MPVDVHLCRIPDDEVGQIPAALVVRRDGSTLSETEVIDYVAKQVSILTSRYICILTTV